MRPSSPVALRWLVAGIVAALTLLGGSLRAPSIDALRASAALEHVVRKGDAGAERAHLDRSSEPSRARPGRPGGTPDDARHARTPAAGAVAVFEHRAARLLVDAPPARGRGLVRRVRPHLEHMVFLI